MIFTTAIVVAQTAKIITLSASLISLLIFAVSLATIRKLRLEIVLIIPFTGLIDLFPY